MVEIEVNGPEVEYDGDKYFTSLEARFYSNRSS